MSDNPSALSPLDGRYAEAVAALRPWLSEHALMQYRVRVELAWFRSLCEHPGLPAPAPLSTADDRLITELENGYSEADTRAIKTIERRINHDVKAVECYLREHFSSAPELAARAEFLHFACTSEDINNLALGLMLEGARAQLCEQLDALLKQVRGLAAEWANIPMLSRTHGQPATPTTVGKEFVIFSSRMQRQLAQVRGVAISGKMNGASGNYNAHIVACPRVNWPAHARQLVEQLGLQWNPHTAQTEPHDYIAELLHALCRLNSVMLDMCRDIWGYISLGYFRPRINQNETGSSTMPHKVNPIEFENAEGNLGIANALAEHLAGKLPISRWQRDLSDSTALRNLGPALGHCLLAYRSIAKGLDRLQVQPARLAEDLDGAWEVLGEAVQTIMRLQGIPSAYEQLKDLSRGREVDRQTLADFIEGLPLDQSAKDRLKALRPADYTGNAAEQARSGAGAAPAAKP